MRYTARLHKLRDEDAVGKVQCGKADACSTGFQQHRAWSREERVKIWRKSGGERTKAEI